MFQSNVVAQEVDSTSVTVAFVYVIEVFHTFQAQSSPV
jgi:hypothetical protein